MDNAQRTALLRDIERYAKSDLYGAARLCKDHLHKDANLRLPTAVMAADRIGKHFEERIREARRPVELYGEQDRQIRQPEDGREYKGPIVGTTPNCLIQRDNETGDLIVHARNTLNRSFEMTGNEEALAISYPFKAVGGVAWCATLTMVSKPSWASSMRTRTTRPAEARRPVELYGEQDRQIRQPEDGREYKGPIVGTT
ncbi:hypothetical protein CTI14_22000, partial [Methylobacterium radiotolerans]